MSEPLLSDEARRTGSAEALTAELQQLRERQTKAEAELHSLMSHKRMSARLHHSTGAALAPGSTILAMSDSEDEEEQRVGDDALVAFVRLVAVQLVLLASATFALSFPLHAWLEELESTDVCLKATHIMSCLDWGLTGGLLCVLFPFTLFTVSYKNPLFRWALWTVWTLCVVADIALFLAGFSWRKYATASVVIMAVYVFVLMALSHLPRSMFLCTWEQTYNWAVKVGLLCGLILAMITEDTNYGYVGIATPIVIIFVIYCVKLVLECCPLDQVILGSMFVLFPEGLLLALHVLQKQVSARPAVNMV